MRIAIILLVIALCVGCASQAPSVTIEKPQPPTEEELLLAQLSNSHLLVLNDLDIEIPAGQRARTMMALKNGQNTEQTFRIEICEYCHFGTTEITLAPNNATIVYFEVEGVPGKKTLVIRDGQNAFYTKKTFTVING